MSARDKTAPLTVRSQFVELASKQDGQVYRPHANCAARAAIVIPDPWTAASKAPRPQRTQRTSNVYDTSLEIGLPPSKLTYHA